MWDKIKVTEGNKSLDVYIPKTNDRIEKRDLEQFAVEKTKEDLRKKEIFNREKKPAGKKEAAEILKDAKAFSDRKNEGVRKYY